MSHHQKKQALRVEFVEPAVQGRADFDAAIAEIATDAGISPHECFEVTRFSMTKPKKTRGKQIGIAEILLLKGCPDTFLSLFQGSHSFKSAALATPHH